MTHPIHLIYCHGRSGSTQLVRSLRQHVDAKRVLDEPFKQKNAVIHGFEPNIREGDNLERYIEYLDATHIKHLWSDIPGPLNKRLLAHPRITSVLFLYRRSLFDYAISMVTATLTKEWHGASAEFFGEIPADKMKGTLDHIVEAIPRHAKAVRSVATATVRCVAYEDLYKMNGSVAQRASAKVVFESLGLRDARVVDAALKTTLSPEKKYKGYDYYRTVFSNFDDMYREFGGYNRHFAARMEEDPMSILGCDRFYGSRYLSIAHAMGKPLRFVRG